MKNFGKRLEEAIRTSGKTKTALALHLGVPQSSVSRWISGSVPRAETLSGIAKFLGVSHEWLAAGVEPSFSSILRDDVAEYRVLPKNDEVPGIPEVMRMLKEQVAPHVVDEVERLLLEHQRERLRMEASDFFGNVGGLVEAAKTAAALLKKGQCADDLRTLSETVAKLMPNIETLVNTLTKTKP